MNENSSQGKILYPFAHFSCLLPDNSSDRIAIKLWWTNHGFSSVDVIIPQWFSMLIYHPMDEQ
jgi:hypothetical protein